jgi:hypothetical protein
MQLMVFIRESLKPAVSKVEKMAENTGFMHVFPNKGGICLSMKLWGTLISFVSCHLTAHEGVQNCFLRNESIKEILGGIRVGKSPYDIVNTSHHIIWMGDMNYRTTFSMENPGDLTKSNTGLVVDDEMLKEAAEADDDDDPVFESEDRSAKFKQVYDYIERERWAKLLQFDELNREIRDGRVLNGFTALQPGFPPTFKRKRKIGIETADVSETISVKDIALQEMLKAEAERSAEEESNAWTDRASAYTEELGLGSRQSSRRRASSAANDHKIKEYHVYTEGSRRAAEGFEDRIVQNFYDKKRIPSYTDRILHHSMPGFRENLKAGHFESCEAVTSSDHKPVRAHFTLKTTLGADGIYCKDAHTLKLEICHLQGRDLAERDAQMFGGLSDPYITMHTDPESLLMRDSKAKSSTIMRTVNPDWSDILSAHIRAADVDGLGKNAHLILAVWDYDMTNPDDVVGVCAIPFANILKKLKRNEAYEFSEMLTWQSEHCGNLSGMIRLKGDLASIEHTQSGVSARRLSTVAEVEKVGACCACSIS